MESKARNEDLDLRERERRRALVCLYKEGEIRVNFYEKERSFFTFNVLRLFPSPQVIN